MNDRVIDETAVDHIMSNVLTITAPSVAKSPPNGKSDNRFRVSERGSFVRLLPIMPIVFLAYLMIGFAMPVLPLHVHQGLGLGMFLVGLESVRDRVEAA